VRRRSPGAGNNRELKVMAVLADEGWLCASRRHIGGAGDILAIGPIPRRPILVEVKSTAAGPWAHFGPNDRAALIRTAREFDAEPWLFWWPPRHELRRLPWVTWPGYDPQLEIEGHVA